MSTKKPKPHCLACGKRVSRISKVYCDNTCQADHYYRAYIARWQAGLETGLSGKCDISHHVRRYILEKAGRKCERCGWAEMNRFTGKIPLTVSHKDGIWQNTTEANLEALCPNCHALTPSYCGRNKGHGRPRYKLVPSTGIPPVASPFEAERVV